ncbi:hypothetical protein DICVIV_00160 [Dictyocaulus viviparus]|uniref:PDZ domain-containing protein n=1 Tax=Dictyocaulus viviparus TaxID=29172 RepID=A0A0D8YGC6_DICVI|nr:hypothetical protein DICVIV_00160 [Dictyocaulus viviparus]
MVLLQEEHGRIERPPKRVVEELYRKTSGDEHQSTSPIQLPKGRLHNLNIRPGFAYYLVELRFVEGMKVGLYVKHYRNQVIISKVSTGSMASKSLRVLDRIIEVNNMPVTDKDVCKTLIINAIQNMGFVTLIVERPVERPAIEIMENALSESVQQPPSVAMPSDVRSIVRRHNEKISGGLNNIEPVKILKRPDSLPKYRPHIQIEDHNRDEYLIGMDNEHKNRKLHKVSKKNAKHSKRNSLRVRKK